MARLNKTKKRIIIPDPVYGSRLVCKLINRVMKDGKKTVAAGLVYKALDLAGKQLKNDNPLTVLRTALENIKPMVEVRSRRVGGAAYQVPTPVRGDRKESLSLRWLVEVARTRPNKDFHTYADKLAAEIVDAYNNQGGAVKKKQDTLRMAEANRAFAHFRW